MYVSAERVRHPDLVGQAVGVRGNNGACVVTKGYEVKARGVKTGTRSAREPGPVGLPAAYALMNGVG